MARISFQLGRTFAAPSFHRFLDSPSRDAFNGCGVTAHRVGIIPIALVGLGPARHEQGGSGNGAKSRIAHGFDEAADEHDEGGKVKSDPYFPFSASFQSFWY